MDKTIMEIKKRKKRLPKPYYETKLGKLYHGDCLDIMPLLSLSEVALLTDPMYGNKTNIKNDSTGRNTGNILGGIILKGRDWDLKMKDDKPFDHKPFRKIKQQIIWGGNYCADKLPANSKWIIWDKRRNVRSDDNADCEMAWTNLKGVSRIHRQLWKGICREGRENIAIQGAKLHPFQKPLNLIIFCLEQFSGDHIIFDPFLGSGTTAVACECLNLKWIGIEILEECCEITAKRIKREVRHLDAGFFSRKEQTKKRGKQKGFF